MNAPRHHLLGLVGEALGADSTLLADFEHVLARGGEFDTETWLEEVDDSDYSLSDWVEALLEFDRWLDRNGEPRRPLESMMGYIHCCTLMQPPSIGLATLKVIVSKSLTEFGFDAASEAQS